MPTLNDMTWKKEGNKWVARSGFKVNPATHPMTVTKSYKVRMADGRFYEGKFTGYCYSKESLDTPLCRVYLEFDISLGHIALEEIDVTGLVQTDIVSYNKPMPTPKKVIIAPKKTPKKTGKVKKVAKDHN